MSEKLVLNDIKNLRLKKILLNFCKATDNLWGSEEGYNGINKDDASKELSEAEHKLVTYLNRKVER